MARIELLYFALIGIACGFVVRDRNSRIISSIIVGVMGAIPGAWLLKWAALFPHGEFVGALVGALIFVGVKRIFTSVSV